jgi:hypothetical protein
MKSRVTFTVVVLIVLIFAVASHAEIKVAVDRNRDAAGDFKFESTPSPSKSDAATKAKFIVVDGRRDFNGGNTDKLHDGKIPTEDDQLREA